MQYDFDFEVTAPEGDKYSFDNTIDGIRVFLHGDVWITVVSRKHNVINIIAKVKFGNDGWVTAVNLESNSRLIHLKYMIEGVFKTIYGSDWIIEVK